MARLLRFFSSTIGRKMVMALTGFVLAGFVLVHMLGNLQFLISPEAINTYAHHLQTLPAPILWGFRAIIALSVLLHVWSAATLAKEKIDARPVAYQVNKTVKASYASRTMMVSGIVLLCFIIFHILHFTVKVAPEPYTPDTVTIELHEQTLHVPDVYTMMVHGFQNKWISVFYLIGTGLLCMHLSHGVSSMFQTVGLRNESWRYKLDVIAFLYGWVVFIGFAIIPLSVMVGWKV